MWENLDSDIPELLGGLCLDRSDMRIGAGFHILYDTDWTAIELKYGTNRRPQDRELKRQYSRDYYQKNKLEKAVKSREYKRLRRAQIAKAKEDGSHAGVSIPSGSGDRKAAPGGLPTGT